MQRGLTARSWKILNAPSVREWSMTLRNAAIVSRFIANIVSPSGSCPARLVQHAEKTLRLRASIENCDPFWRRQVSNVKIKDAQRGSQ